MGESFETVDSWFSKLHGERSTLVASFRSQNSSSLRKMVRDSTSNNSQLEWSDAVTFRSPIAAALEYRHRSNPLPANLTSRDGEMCGSRLSLIPAPERELQQCDVWLEPRWKVQWFGFQQSLDRLTDTSNPFQSPDEDHSIGASGRLGAPANGWRG